MYAIKIKLDKEWVFVRGDDTGDEPKLFDRIEEAEQNAYSWKVHKKGSKKYKTFSKMTN